MAEPGATVEGRWRGRPVLSGLVRAVVLGVPLLSSFLAVRLAGRLVHPDGHRVLWIAAYVALGLLVALGTQRLTRRLLPLAAVLKLTMLFPDRAPSRFKVARGASSTRRLQQRVARSPDDTEVNAAEKILMLVGALAAHDRRTRGHAERVRAYTDLLAEQLKLPREARDRLRWSALLHDIGKLEVAAEILNKAAEPNPDEWDQLRRHPALGAEIAEPLLPWLGEWGPAIIEHHERYDGNGYPRGLAGDQISLGGRIVCLVDAFEVMTAARSYKPAMATRSARAELTRCAGGQFDPHLVRAFLEISLPRLLWAMGPLSFLLQIPFLRDLQHASGQLGTQLAAGTAATAVAGVTSIATAGGVPALHIPTHRAERVAVAASQPVTPPATRRPDLPPPRRPPAGRPDPGPAPRPGAPTPPAAPAPPLAASPVPAPPAPARPPAPAPPQPVPPPPAPAPPRDTDAPVVTIDSAPSGTIGVDSATVVFRGDDPAASYACQLDGGPWSLCTSPVTVSGLTDGMHAIGVRGTDPAGNVGPAAVVAFTVDTGAPVTTITAAPGVLVATPAVSVGFTSDDPAASYECRLDGGAWAACTSPASFTLADGAHRIEVHGISATGRVGAPARVDVRVDTRAPVASFRSAPPARTVSPSVTASFSSDEPGVSFACSLDSGAWSPCAATATFSGLADGVHSLAVRAADPAGNTGPAASASFTVDAAGPVLRVKPPAVSSNNNAVFGFLPASGLTAECRLDAGAWVRCLAGASYRGLRDGRHTFQARWVDGNGARSAVTSYSWLVNSD